LVAVGLVGAAVTAVVAFLTAHPGADQNRNADQNSRAAQNSRTSDPGPSPSAGPPPPIRLKLADQGAAVVLSWNDPSEGTVSFVVAYGHADKAAENTQRLPAGTTSITINGLNAAVDYCFTVAGIESTTTIALSPLVCTQRSPGSPQASATR
jgi:hypothetical protein